ncbi:phosphoserine transaminase [Agarivorans gilvus]|jgi:phosphoserine aminotransferase|uniref:phosphoserine transaminase n=1 Tax=Agarivorans gilvus TaxID=680279 RepID=A0ABQ1I3U1_9ALTE|nr:phosphoserine transaminase [Agarivorans gilvus]GGB08919.1 phosphoserine aminotransferase [Agarivorans gilvus]
MKPLLKPQCPNFSSGPCAKRPGYQLNQLEQHSLGRSHRSQVGKAQLAEAIRLSEQILQLPQGYKLGIVPGSDTGAMEMAMWSLLGPKPVDIFSWESFGKGWFLDVSEQLKLAEVHHYHSEYGLLPDFSQANPEHDCIFTWNGTTSGVALANADWISSQRSGLTLCDATSAVFAMPLDWQKLDVVTYSWQKVLGGEGAHGVIILSPRAVARLESYQPCWPMPKIFRLTQGGKLIEGIFKGETINTPSMLCVADYIDALRWLESLGGLSASINRSRQNLQVISQFVSAHPWIAFLAQQPETISNTSVCLTLEATAEQVETIIGLLEQQQVAYDIGAYRDAPAGLRIWCGATVEQEDLRRLLTWLTWAYQQVCGK